MADIILRTNASRQDVLDAVRRLPGILSARQTGFRLPRQKMLAAIGVVVLQKISENFRVMMRGGTGASGLRWERLSTETVRRKKKARRRGELWGPLQILYETGTLERSLRPPSRPSGANVPVKRPAQVFSLGRNFVEVGTTRPWALAHHEGIPPWLPRRRLWPEPKRWPRHWWRLILAEVRAGMVDVLAMILGARP